MLAIGGVILVLDTATPLPLWTTVSWTILALIGLILLNLEASTQRALLVVCSALLLSTVALCVAEAPHHFAPKLSVPAGTKIYVLGDSISADISSKMRCWPEVLDQTTPFRVVNLAQGGAIVEDAIVQAEGIKRRQSVVIVEIGGNNLLYRRTGDGPFAAGLETLISKLRSEGHRVLMFELPLPPFHNAWAQAQRDIAARYEVDLLPKRYFTKVLGMKNGTVDGIHLSQTGHDKMARIVAGTLGRP